MLLNRTAEYEKPDEWLVWNFLKDQFRENIPCPFFFRMFWMCAKSGSIPPFFFRKTSDSPICKSSGESRKRSVGCVGGSFGKEGKGRPVESSQVRRSTKRWDVENGYLRGGADITESSGKYGVSFAASCLYVRWWLVVPFFLVKSKINRLNAHTH